MKKLTFVSLELLLATSSVSAQKPDDKKAAAAKAPAGLPQLPKAPAQMDQFKFLIGKWNCQGKQFAGYMGPEHAFEATLEARNDGEGFYQSWMYEEKASKVHLGLKTQGVWGWNRTDGKFVRAAADNRGNWDKSTTPGFESGKLVWTGEITGSASRLLFQQNVTKKSDQEFTFVFEAKGPDGKWVPASEVTCKR